jgi:hypothetical protein
MGGPSEERRSTPELHAALKHPGLGDAHGDGPAPSLQRITVDEVVDVVERLEGSTGSAHLDEDALPGAFLG